MRLLEYQAKQIFNEHGIRVPKAVLITKSTGLPVLPLPVVLKAQVTVGGRGKAGAIRVVRESCDLASVLADLFRMNVKGQAVSAVLAEEMAEIQKECYLAVLVDKGAKLPVIVASGQGGVDIEEVARVNPGQIVKKHIDPTIGLQDFTVRYIARAMGLDDWTGLRVLLDQMLAVYREMDATLVEINPLAVTPDGLLALYAKVILDEKAAFRHAEQYTRLKLEQDSLTKTIKSPAECLAADRGITYVPLGGEVGLISDGAGTGMLTIDLIHDLGGHAADFCELGGLGNADRMRQAIEVVLSEPQVRSLLITLIGGLTRMDDMANGIADYLSAKEASVPLVVRMCGTQEEAGKAILHEVGIQPYDDLMQAAKKAVELARNGS